MKHTGGLEAGGQQLNWGVSGGGGGAFTKALCTAISLALWDLNFQGNKYEALREQN